MRTCAWILPCCLLAACEGAEEQDRAAGKNLKTWNGKTAQIALGALGRPDRILSGPNGKLYIWIGKRQVGTHVYTVTDSSGGQSTYFDPKPGATMTAPCRVQILTDKNGVITNSSLKGTPLGCQPFAKEINASQGQ